MFLNVDQLEKQLDNKEFQEIRSMDSFKVLETQFQMFINSQIYLNDEYIVMTRNYFLEYTRLDIPEFRDTLIQNMDYVKKSIEKRALHKMEYDSRVNERLMQTTEEKVDSSKALDASLVIIESNGTESQKQDTSNRSGNDAHVNDVDIRPIYNEEPMAKVQTTDDNVSATGQQHTEQPASNNEGEVDQNADQCCDTRPLPAKFTLITRTIELSNHLLESGKLILKLFVLVWDPTGKTFALAQQRIESRTFKWFMQDIPSHCEANKLLMSVQIRLAPHDKRCLLKRSLQASFSGQKASDYETTLTRRCPRQMVVPSAEKDRFVTTRVMNFSSVSLLEEYYIQTHDLNVHSFQTPNVMFTMDQRSSLEQVRGNPEPCSSTQTTSLATRSWKSDSGFESYQHFQTLIMPDAWILGKALLVGQGITSSPWCLRLVMLDVKETKNCTAMSSAEAEDVLVKGLTDGKKSEDSFYQTSRSGSNGTESDGLLTMDDGIVNWGEHTEVEETNHALMAISSSNEWNRNESFKRKGTIAETLDSWKDSSKNLWRLINSGMSSNSKVGLGFEIQSNNEVLSYEEEMNFSVFNCSKEDSVGKPLYSRFTKTNDFKGVPHPLSGDYTPTPQEEIDESLYVYGSIGTSSEHSVDPESEISSVPPEVYVSTPVTTNEKGVSDPKTKEIEPSCVSHIKTPRQPIKDQATPKVNRKNWNAMMERELGEENVRSGEFKKQRFFILLVPTRTSNSFSPKRPQVNQFNQRGHFSKSYSSVRRPFAKNYSITMSHSHAVKGNWGSAVKTSVGYNWRNSKPNSNCDSGPTFIRTVNAKGPQGRTLSLGTRPGNKDQLEDFEEFNGGSVTFGGSKGYISDNGTEFKNRDMLEFCGNKGIKQEYSNARTPQQNGVAERMNRTLIEVARTMLADSLLPTTFWAEAVSMLAIFIQGFLVGYSLNSKAYRVYNLVTKRVEVNLHVNFLKDKPNVKGVGYRWMFDIDYLTDSMNYIPVSLKNQANPHAGASEVTNNAGTSQTPSSNASEEKDEDVKLIVVPSTVRNTEEKAESRKSSTNSKKEEILTELQQEKKASSTDTSEDNPKILAFRRELEEINLEHLGKVSENTTTSTPLVNTGSKPVNTGSFDHDDSPMPELKIFHKSETRIFDEASYDEEGVITDFNSLPTEIEVSPTSTPRISQ
ncbi:retrovirus-related pol polyprotein from transposon TNT 1-94 [Tanacetum coccineum]